MSFKMRNEGEEHEIRKVKPAEFRFLQMKGRLLNFRHLFVRVFVRPASLHAGEGRAKQVRTGYEPGKEEVRRG